MRVAAGSEGTSVTQRDAAETFKMIFPVTTPHRPQAPDVCPEPTTSNQLKALKQIWYQIFGSKEIA